MGRDTDMCTCFATTGGPDRLASLIRYPRYTSPFLPYRGSHRLPPIIIQSFTYKIVACRLLHRRLRSVSKRYARVGRDKACEECIIDLTNITKNGSGPCFQLAAPQLSTVKLSEDLLSELEATAGRVDGGKNNGLAGRYVGQIPAPGAA